MMTQSKLQSLINALGDLASAMRDDQQFDEAETVDDACGYLAKMLSAAILPDVEETILVTADMTALRDLCVQMKEKQARLLDLKVQTAEVRGPFDDLRLKIIPSLMETLGVRTATFQGLGRVQTAPDLYASTRKGKKEDAMQWLRDCGHESLIKETYNASSIKAIFRAMIKDGVDIPDEIFSVTPFIRASIVKA